MDTIASLEREIDNLRDELNSLHDQLEFYKNSYDSHRLILRGIVGFFNGKPYIELPERFKGYLVAARASLGVSLRVGLDDLDDLGDHRGAIQ